MHTLGEALPFWTLVPFVGLLLSIAIVPLVAGHWWHQDRNRALVAAGWATPIALYFPLVHGAAGWHPLAASAHEYVSFIALIGSLFLVSGGIVLRGSLPGTPLVNTLVLAIGAALANLIGTTGASMLLIRPLLRANAARAQRAHIVVFFIFTVSNCGGLLTPLGDPPLYLGFLKGVPFAFTLRLWPYWLAVNGALLVLFHLWDQVMWARDARPQAASQRERVSEDGALRIDGAHNALFLLGIMAAIYGSGEGLLNGGEPWPFPIPELVMGAMAFGAWVTTRPALRAANGFDFGPMNEVAILFAGIFVTMGPALLFLNVHAPALRLSEPTQYFWATGLVSAFLDNAPTYLTFAATACGLAGVPAEGRYLAEYVARGGEGPVVLAAISMGAVFLGALTYIGNGPNFMVKAIAEDGGVTMPSFFGYLTYSIPILIPILLLVGWAFGR